MQEFGRIDVLFNSAYDPGSFEPIEEASMDGWRRAMDVNFFGTMYLTQACVRHMKNSGGGAIVMIATMVEHKPLATQARLWLIQVGPAVRYQASGPGAGKIQYPCQQLPHGLDVGPERGGLF